MFLEVYIHDAKFDIIDSSLHLTSDPFNQTILETQKSLNAAFKLKVMLKHRQTGGLKDFSRTECELILP